MIEGISLTLTNPELLRAYIQESRDMRPATLAERMSGIRETPLAEFPLGGSLFTHARFTLVVEPDRDPRAQRPTAIIRADLQLGNQNSSLSEFQLNKVSGKETDPQNHPIANIREAFEKTPVAAKTNIQFVWYGPNTAHIAPPLERETFSKQALTLLQVWDPDAATSSISISLLSRCRYNDVWDRRYREKTERDKKYKQNGWELDGETPEEYADRWNFNLPVGIDCYDPAIFQEAIQVYTQSFPLILRAIYATEGLTVPNVNLEIAPPPILKEDKTITFNDIGGHAQAKDFLRLLADRAKSGVPARPMILAGPPGNGKTSLARAFATELGGIMVKKTSNDLPSGMTADEVRNFIRASYLEAQAAATAKGGRAVLLLENLEYILDPDGRVHDFLLNEIDNWTTDYSSRVILMITTNAPDRIHGGIIDRAYSIPVLPPDKQGIQEILQIHIGKIERADGKSLFANLDLDKIVGELKERNISGHGIKALLEGAYAFSKRGQEITTKSFLALLDLVSAPRRKIGFQGS